MAIEEDGAHMAKRKARIQHAEIIQRFASRLKELRLARDLTQAQLARQAHVALSHLSKLENGEAAPGLDLLDRLAHALGVTAIEMIPAPVDADVLSELRERTKRLFEGVMGRADSDTLAMLATLLGRL
jgi:transcriptional regulator with XRE-family HTH domain